MSQNLFSKLIFSHSLPQVVMIAVLLIVTQVSCTRPGIAPADPTADNLSLTSTHAPLPQDAFKARISFAYETPAKVRAGEKLSVHILVKNASNVLWPYAGELDGKYQIRLGNRWVDQNGKTTDDGRGALSYDLRPGDETEVVIVVSAPTTPGEYDLELDLVQEQVAWFAERGSEGLGVKVTVQ